LVARSRLSLALLVLAGVACSVACSASDESLESEDDELRGGIAAKVASTVAAVPKGPPPAGRYRVHMIDVGTGMAFLIQGHDFTVLFDGGSSDDRGTISRSGNRNRLIAYLYAALGPSGPKECVPDGDPWPVVDSPRIKIDHVFLSHPHNDHVNMLDDVMRCYRAEHVWDPGSIYQTVAYRNFIASFAEDASVRYHTSAVPPESKAVRINDERLAIAGRWTHFRASADAIDLGRGASFKILHANGAWYSDANQNSLVVSFKLGSKKVLVTSDADSGERDDPSAPIGFIEKYLVQVHRDELKSDILQVGHHGSKTSSRLEFLRVVNPSWALIPVGPALYTGVKLPDPEVLDALVATNRSMKILRTDTNDRRCPEADRIGFDDHTPGGCDNHILEIAR
jgi:competence protein ComEC